MKLIECVPNFSEGVDESIIKEITHEISSVNNVTLLDVDPGKDTNRTVVTFIGTPDKVISAAFLAIKKAAILIDMTKHKGEHPRMGATDVCPLIPITGVSMDECVKYSHQLAKKVADELNISVFLYEESASNAKRKNLSNIRKGEYEGMQEKLQTKDWTPDYGPNILNEKSGVTAIGARNFLIAYNVNLNTRDKKIATDIALDIREAGRARRDKNNKILRKKDGSMRKIPGSLKETKAVGWYIDEYKKAQVSINLTNFNITSIHSAFEEVRNQANKRGVRVTGSEIVGLVPKQALIESGLFYLTKQKKSTAIPEKDIIDIAIDSLGLNEISPFNQFESIIENRIGQKKRLVDMSNSDFIDEVSQESPAPGGGSVSAQAGALAAALIAMVANLSFGKKEYLKNNEVILDIGNQAQFLKKKLLILVDEDSNAFDKIMSAIRMPRKTENQKEERDVAITLATKHAIDIPFKTMELSMQVLTLSKKIMKIGNKNSISDAGVASEMSFAAIKGAYMNVLINLKDIYDDSYRDKVLNKANKILKRSDSDIRISREYLSKKIK